MDSFQRSVANLPPRVGDDGFNKTVEDIHGIIHGIVARSKKLLGAMKFISTQCLDPPSSASASVPRTLASGSGARGGAGEWEPSPTRSIIIIMMLVTSSTSAAKRPRSAQVSDASQGVLRPLLGIVT